MQLENKSLYAVEVRHKFNASHQLPDTEDLVTKECARLHGHLYMVKVTLTATKLQNGFVVDFKKVKQTIDQLDHRHLNDILPDETTAENIARYLYNLISDAMPTHCSVEHVSLCEGYVGEELTSWVTYYEVES